ncbi:MAG: hypothetical protein EBR47_04615 [Betaproteobacteria bacterium]|jgi:hypothetical protein|nr:hypothetical protein [Betaproteobacteria bacterium]
MSSKTVWRNLAFLLVLANLVFWLWSQGYLRPVGMGPKSVQEPQRLKDQVEPQALTIQGAASQESK